MSYSYALTSGSWVLRSDGASLPDDPGNTDWRAYQAWLAAGNTPTPVPPPTLAALSAYAKQVWTALLAKGETFDVAGDGAAPLMVLCDGTNATRADLALLALWGQTNPSATKTWIDNNGVAMVLTGTQLVTLATLAGNWVSDMYPALASLLASITANPPTVTTTAAIDATAWPTR